MVNGAFVQIIGSSFLLHVLQADTYVGGTEKTANREDGNMINRFESSRKQFEQFKSEFQHPNGRGKNGQIEPA